MARAWPLLVVDTHQESPEVVLSRVIVITHTGLRGTPGLRKGKEADKALGGWAVW